VTEIRLVPWFADAMAERLDANSHKHGWRDMTPRRLLRRLRQELGELARALARDPVDATTVTREAADVANFAAMIADVVREAEPDAAAERE